MPKRTKKDLQNDPSANWTRSDSTTINGRNVVKGTELRIKGERGRFRFMGHTTTDKGKSWIDTWSKEGGQRSFRVEDVKTVHSKNKTGVNLAAARKAAKKTVAPTPTTKTTKKASTNGRSKKG